MGAVAQAVRVTSARTSCSVAIRVDLDAMLAGLAQRPDIESLSLEDRQPIST
jgi:hypothetical protein